MKKVIFFIIVAIISKTIYTYDLEIDITTKSINTKKYNKKTIKEEEIKNIKDLSELINTVSVNFSKTQPGALGSVWINGVKTTDSDIYSSSGVLLLINGHPVNGLIDNIPIEAVEKIEIIEGPFSSSYGSGSISGIINIITKKKGNNKVGIDFNYGSFDYMKPGFFIGFDKDIRIIAAASYEERKDYETTNKKYLNTDYKKENAYIGFLIPTESNIFEGSFIYLKGKDIGVPFKIQMNDPDDYVNILNLVSDIKVTTYIDNNVITNLLYISYNKRSNYGIDPLWPYESHTKIKTIGYQPNIYIINDILNISGGLDISYSTISKQNESGNYNQPNVFNINFGSFVEFSKNILEKLNIFVGSRYDLYHMKIEDSKGITFIGDIKEKSFKYLSFKSGLNYEFYDKILIKTSFGTGFRTPSILERYGTYIGPWGNYQGNPYLKPEKSIGFSSTIGYYGKNSLYMGVDYLEIKDRIATYFDTSTFVTSYYNQEKAKISNLKVGIEYSILSINSLSIILKSDFIYNVKNEDKNGKKLLYIPLFKSVANININTNFIHIIINNTYTGKVYDIDDKNIGEYNLLNIFLTSSPIKIDDNKELKIKAKINNITNEYYQFVDGFPMPKRNYEIGLEYSMNI